MSLLQLNDISKSYQVGSESVHALRSVSLSVAAGEMVALTGPSGSGKSTLLNICGLIDRSDRGDYRFQQQSVSAMIPPQLTQLRREALGFVFQSFNLIPVMSAAENVEYPLLLNGIAPVERRRAVAEILARVGLTEFAKQRPDKLSGGQRQRVAIARALVKRPAVVIADEPTANLDSQTAEQMVELMKSLGREIGSTFIIATHDERMSRHCDRVLQLKDGVIL